MWDHGQLIHVQLTLAAGALSGFAAGIVMLASFMVLSKALESDVWWLPNRLGAVLLSRTQAGPISTYLGLAAHFVASAGFGAVYAIIVSKLTYELWMTGLAFGLTLWLMNFWGGFLSPAGREMMQKKPAWLSPIVHLVYGAMLALVAQGFVAHSI
jgi:hypothetical protein